MRQSPALPGCACAEGAALARLRWVGAEGEARVATPPFGWPRPPLGWPRPLCVQATPPAVLGPGGGAGWERVKIIMIRKLKGLTVE